MSHARGAARRWAVATALWLPALSGMQSALEAAESEIRRSSNGYWLYIDGQQKAAFTGVVYQPVPHGKVVHDFENNWAGLYRQLDNESRPGGAGHAREIANLGFSAIRVYELPLTNADDVRLTKQVFRRLYEQHGITVLVGHWCGLYPTHDLSQRRNQLKTIREVRTLAKLYGREPWVLGWQLGNENNYHVRDGKLGSELNIELRSYYDIMNRVAGALREVLAEMSLRQVVLLGQGDLTPQEAELIRQRVPNIDAVGINCYRDPDGIEELVQVAQSLERPIVVSEFGIPADRAGNVTGNTRAGESHSSALNSLSDAIFRHAAGYMGSGIVLGAFIHEATDQTWKAQLRGHSSDGEFGILGKQSRYGIRDGIRRREEIFSRLPRNDSPVELEKASWGFLSRARELNDDSRGRAMYYAGRIIQRYSAAALYPQRRSGAETQEAPGEDWAKHVVGVAWFIKGSAQYEIAQSLIGRSRSPQRQEGDERRGRQLLDEARRTFDIVIRDFGDAQVRGQYRNLLPLREAVVSLFPDMVEPYFRLTTGQLSGLAFALSALILYRPLTWLIRWHVYARRSYGLYRESGPGLCIKAAPRWQLEHLITSGFIFFQVLMLLAFAHWWINPVRGKFYIVHPALYWVLTVVILWYGIFYIYVSRVLSESTHSDNTNEVPEGLRVAVVTTFTDEARESIDILETSLNAMARMHFPHHTFVLDEGNSQTVRFRCNKLDTRMVKAGKLCQPRPDERVVVHFSRQGIPEYNQKSGEFQAQTKGGNLNSWLDAYGDDYDVAVFFDPDHQPCPEYLHRVLNYFSDPKVGFVQPPAAFSNEEDSWVAGRASEQGAFFHGPIQLGLFGLNCCMINGSHTAIRVSALRAIGGYAVHDADDVLTSLRLHACGYKGVFVPEVLAKGLVPDDWGEYLKQQRRWARSMFSLLFFYIPPLITKLRPGQTLAFFLLCAFYFNHIAFVVLSILPVLAVLSGRTVANVSLMEAFARLGAVVLPFVALFITTYIYWYRGHGLRRIARLPGAGLLALSCWWEVLRAFVEAVYLGRRVPLREVTAKQQPDNPDHLPRQVSGWNAWASMLPHFCWFAVATTLIVYVLRTPGSPTIGMVTFLVTGALAQLLIWRQVTR